MLGDRSEFHVNFTGASNKFGATATTPVQMLNERWSAVYTTPQTYKNQLAFLNATQSYRATDTLTFKSNAYYRGFWQKHDDGNTSDAGPCDADSFPGFLSGCRGCCLRRRRGRSAPRATPGPQVGKRYRCSRSFPRNC